MKFPKAGIILNTQQYQKRLNFYEKVIGLKILHKIDRPGEKLTCFALGDIYLMVETGGNAHIGVKPIEQCPTKFRFNVEDVSAVCIELQEKGLDLQIRHHEWGTTAEFSDPDGNRCALRSDKGFGLWTPEPLLQIAQLP